MTEFVYPEPPGGVPARTVTLRDAKGGTYTKRACTALTWHGTPCGRPALEDDILCNSHREQVQRRKNPVKLIGGGEVKPEDKAPVVDMFSGEEVDLAGLDTSRQPLPPEERRRLAYLQMEHVVQHGTLPQRTKAAELIFKFTPDLEKEAAERRDLDDEIFGLMEAMSLEAGIEMDEPVDPVVQVRQLVARFTQAQMDAHLDWLVRQGVYEEVAS